jgi:hypothetical protein
MKNNTIKMENDLSNHFSKEEMQMIYKYMQNSSISLAIR